MMTEFNFPNPENPSEVAEKVSKEFIEKGYNLDFSITSLKNEIDLVLKNESSKDKELLETKLTAYFGETICRLFNVRWSGQYFGSLHGSARNYYLCKITKAEFNFSPSHFFRRYFSNGSKKLNPFKDYLEHSYHSVGSKQYVGDGLLKKIENLGK